MISLEERKDILNDEVEILVEQGWTVLSRTDTTCFLTKEAKGLGCFSMIMTIVTFLPFAYTQNRTRTIEISPEGEIKRSWLKL